MHHAELLHPCSLQISAIFKPTLSPMSNHQCQKNSATRQDPPDRLHRNCPTAGSPSGTPSTSATTSRTKSPKPHNGSSQLDRPHRNLQPGHRQIRHQCMHRHRRTCNTRLSPCRCRQCPCRQFLSRLFLFRLFLFKLFQHRGTDSREAAGPG